MINLTIEDKNVEEIFLHGFQANKEKFFEFIKLSFSTLEMQKSENNLSYLQDRYDEAVKSELCNQSHDEIWDELIEKYARD